MFTKLVSNSIKKAVRYCGKTIRNLYVSEAGLKAAKNKIRSELRQMGLLSVGSPLDEVQCIHAGALSKETLSGIVGVMGFFYPWDQNIHIPAVCFASLFPWAQGRCLADVLRHEYGHALEGKYPKFIHNNEFRKVFGKAYGDKKSSDTNANHYVSTYAMTCSQEDFAETFMYYIKHKGKVPLKWSDNRAIRAKWSFIDGLCTTISKQIEPL